MQIQQISQNYNQNPSFAMRLKTEPSWLLEKIIHAPELKRISLLPVEGSGVIKIYEARPGDAGKSTVEFTYKDFSSTGRLQYENDWAGSVVHFLRNLDTNRILHEGQTFGQRIKAALKNIFSKD